jgi:hypothetical protein
MKTLHPELYKPKEDPEKREADLKRKKELDLKILEERLKKNEDEDIKKFKKLFAN